MERSQRLCTTYSPEVRGERGMLSGTSTTSHMLFLKDAWPRAEAGSRTCDRSSAPVHLNKLPMPCCRCIPFRRLSQSFIRHKSLAIQIIQGKAALVTSLTIIPLPAWLKEQPGETRLSWRKRTVRAQTYACHYKHRAT